MINAAAEHLTELPEYMLTDLQPGGEMLPAVISALVIALLAYTVLSRRGT